MRVPALAISVTLACLLVGFLAASAHALWSIRSLVNHTDQILSLSIPIYPGGAKDSQNMLISGNLVVAIPGHGVVSFQDKGHNTPCERPHWGVAISYNDQNWGFFYDGGGTIDVTINADGSLALVPGPAGQIVVGTGPPKCIE